jgi:hypothetical protein
MNATQSAQAAQSAHSARHPVNIGHLVMGIAFLGLVGIWSLVQADVVHGGDVRWLLPVPWVLAGIAGLLATTITGKRRYGTNRAGWVDTRDPHAEPAYDPDPNRDLDEKIDAAERERRATRATDTAETEPEARTEPEAEPHTADPESDSADAAGVKVDDDGSDGEDDDTAI